LDSLKSLHTFSFSADCRQVMTINSVDSLISCLEEVQRTPNVNEYLVLGEGSNTVFVEDYPYPVLLNRIKGIELNENADQYFLTVGAGENWHELVTFCVEKGIGGFENLALIPGTVGASPIQNIGAYGVEIEKFIEKVEFLDTVRGSIHCLTKQECDFAYRDSIFKRQLANTRIITRVFFTLPKRYDLVTSYGPLATLISPSIKDIYNAVVELRKSKLPDVETLGNAGSFFKNPVISKDHFGSLQLKYSDIVSYSVDHNHVKVPAAWLIDKLGFKGKRIGDIGCHINQPLVLVNLGDGQGSDLLTLAREIRNSVQSEFNIELENEVRLMGQKGAVTL
jgi:UDP-N-acetylmuramate dehydrogenase